MPIPLTDDELAGYAAYAEEKFDLPLLAMVAELRARRAGDGGAPWAILVVHSEAAAALVPQVMAAAGAPVLVLAPDGTSLRQLQMAARRPCLMDTYDPERPQELRELLKRHRIALV